MNRPLNNELKAGLKENEFFVRVDVVAKVPLFF